MRDGVRIVCAGPRSDAAAARALERVLDGATVVVRSTVAADGFDPDCVVYFGDDYPDRPVSTDAPVLVVGPDDPAAARAALDAGAADYAAADTAGATPPVLARRVHTLAARTRGETTVEALASVVSHDLRNPLHVARAYLDMLDDAPEVETVASSLDRIERVAEDVLVVARPDAPVDAVDRESLAAVATAAWDHVDPDGAALVDVADLEVTAAHDRLHRLLAAVFENVAARSVRQMATGGDEVSVRVGTVADGFYVEDDGPPVPAADRPRLFRVQPPSADEGTGVTMAIADVLAAAHGWTLTLAESDAVTRFEVRGVA